MGPGDGTEGEERWGISVPGLKKALSVEEGTLRTALRIGNSGLSGRKISCLGSAWGDQSQGEIMSCEL